MKVLCPCGKFYLSENGVCPVCGHRLTKSEQTEALAQQEAFQREARARMRTGMSEWPRDKALRKELRHRKAKQAAADHDPVSVVLLSTSDRRSALETVIHALLTGGFLGLGKGASQPTHATFSVKYASGRTGTETVKVNSQRFRELNALLHS